MLARMRRKRLSFALLVGMQTGAATLENSMEGLQKIKNMGMQAGAATLENSVEVPQKTKNRTTIRSSNCTTRHLPMGYRCAVLNGHMHPHVYSSTINNSQSMETAQMSIDG